MAEECMEMTTFVSKFGTFKFEVMPFGLKNAPATFQRMMDHLFRDVAFVCVYLDDFVVFSRSMEENLGHLKEVFALLAKFKLKVKIEKCEFAKPRVSLLGHVVDSTGVSTDEGKVRAIQEAPRPRTR